MLEAKSLSCVRDERILFSELSFSVQPGDIIQVEAERRGQDQFAAHPRRSGAAGRR